jgi:Na+/H+ antiporter NhaA
MADAQATPMSGRTAWARNLAAPVREFLGTETGSAIVLFSAIVAALIWANSPWPDSYESVWTTELSFQLGHWTLSADLRHWVNDGLMTLFFLVVGLEAKRELDVGELRERSRLAVPVIAAIGGMAGAIAIYLAFNAGGPGAGGWGAVMSTETALALGILALVGPEGATRLRVFMLSLVVVDDLAGLLVIATVYTEHIEVIALIVALALFGVLFALRYVPVGRSVAAAVVGTAMWVALFESGIHPTIAGLAIGLVTTAYPPSREDLERVTDVVRSFREQPSPELARSVQASLASAISANERLQLVLHPWTSYVIVPLFALANAGFHLDGGLLRDAMTSPITLGIALGYVVGKPTGIAVAAWLATRRGRARRPLPITWPGLLCVGSVAGIGFTVSLLIASLAFHGQELDEARVGILLSIVLATLDGWLVTQLIKLIPASARARQLLGTAEAIQDLVDDVDPARDHIRGPNEAPVTLLEFGDYECPYCGEAEPTIRALLADFGDDLRYVWRHLPLTDVHSNAQLAAEATEAAAAQDRFWDMHDELLAHQDELRPFELVRHARDIGLDVERFWDELRRREHAPRVAEDVVTADASGVTGTPTFFINGRRYTGAYDIDTLTRVVQAARDRARPAEGAAVA